MATNIEWTDETWNPVTGCTKVSPGCDHCYAKTMHERFNGAGSFDTITLHPDRLDIPKSWRKPRRVFVNSMSDLFHKDVPDEFIARVWQAMATSPQHTFQILTKRPARMKAWLDRCADAEGMGWITHNGKPVDGAYAERGTGGIIVGYGTLPGSIDYRYSVGHRLRGEGQPGWPLPNVWLGVSTENQKWADVRIPALLDTPATVRFISAEPLLGPIDLLDVKHLDWVIVGGESGAGARPMRPDWALGIRNACENSETPFLFKQWGSHDSTGKRMSKKAAGRELDGRTWDEYPVGA